MDRRTFLTSSAALCAASVDTASAARKTAAETTQIPMRVENNQILAYFGFPAAGGKNRKLLTQIDTGGGVLLVARKAVEELGLKIERRQAPHGFAFVALDRIFVGSKEVHIPTAGTTEHETLVFHPGAAAPAFFAASVLRDRAVTFDYPGGTFALDGPSLGGVQLRVGIANRTAFPRVELNVDGETMGFLLDTGASFTMLSQSVIRKLRTKNPSWSYAHGAYGPANMLGRLERNADMLRIPRVRWGSIALDYLDVVSRPHGTFETYMSSMMSAPVVGALGGNALRNFALRLDYPNASLEARFEARPWPSELAIVPLILEPRVDGSFTIAGGSDARDLVGGRLLTVDGRKVDDLSLYAVQQLLRGAPGTFRTLKIDTTGLAPREVRLRTARVLS